MATVGENNGMSNERLRELLYNAIYFLNESYYSDMSVDEAVEQIDIDIDIKPNELEELGFYGWGDDADFDDTQVVEPEEPPVSYWQDFTQAEKLGKKSIMARFDCAFSKHKDDDGKMAVLTNALALKAHSQKTNNHAFAELYNELWQKVVDYATMNYSGTQLDNYLRLTEA